MRNDFIAQRGAVLAPAARAAETFDAGGEVAEFDAGGAGGEDAVQGAVQLVEESEFVAGTGGLGQRGEGYAHGWFAKPEAAGNFRITDHLEHAGDEGAQALTGDDVFFEFAFKVGRHALGHVRGEPPTAVSRTLRGLGHGTLEPDALVFDGTPVGESDERKVVGESDHEKLEG